MPSRPTRTPKQRFETARDQLLATGAGLESTMYGPLRDLFVEVLGYEPQCVDIDRSGARGRPDLTVFADGGVTGTRVPWIVLEAKDERGVCRDAARRAALFAEKSKYITADTAWFVMVDPDALVARPADRGADPSADLVLDLAGLDFDAFVERLAPLGAGVAGVPHLLARFRDGDETLIGVDRLSGTGDALAEELARAAFFDGLEETTRHLQAATLGALTAIRSERDAISAEVAAFSERFHGHEFRPYPVSIEGRPKGREEAIEHGREAHRLNRMLAADPALARLALSALPAFAERTGIDKPDKLDEIFATETANLILARILLIRFLEDHGFFDEETPDGTRRRRYLCNGGVKAFQGMRGYFDARYTRLLEDAYRSGARVYAAAFRETEHDWVLDLADDALSRTVEWAMFRVARFDFTTVRGDILTGVYDRFLDARQRKAQGEFYTPPSIARYMLDRLDLSAEDRVLDPACGSGTFLIERYQQAVGEDADRGMASYEDARALIEHLAGNDLNPFSAVLTQIQLLWHLLSFGPVVRREGLPAIQVAERANSLVPTSLRDQSTTRWGDVDVPGYAAVVGNPPYVRPERGAAVEATAHDYYRATITAGGRAHAGISPESNLYNLFVYRALDHWCAPSGEEGATPGKLAFVIPLGFCTSDNSADLRRLFALGGRWTITEIVDMELIWSDVFDADVLPMILFAEARPARAKDRVVIRHVDEASVIRPAGERRARPSFDIARAPEARIAYGSLFTPEERIATRMTPRRAEIVGKLRALPPLREAAKRYWTKRKGGFEAVDVEPGGVGRSRWAEQRMVTDGVARRNTGTEGSPGGLDVYKGENIRTAGLVGDPVFTGLDVENLSTPSVWRFPDILPDRMWCLPILEQVPCAAPLDPRRAAVTNTATVFGPRPDLEAFPFDLLLASRIYGWVSLLSLRTSFLNKLRTHLYPSVIGALPWSEELVARQEELEALRAPFLDACEGRYEADAALRERAAALGLIPLRAAVRAAGGAGARLVWSAEIEEGGTFELDAPPEADDPLEADDPPEVDGLPEVDDPRVVALSPDGHTVTLPTEELAGFLRLGLALVNGQEMSKGKLLALPVPGDEETAEALRALLATLDPVAAEVEVEAQVDAIDRVVGGALDLTPEEVAFVQADMRGDPFLSRVRPRYPSYTPSLRGRRRALERASRYA